MATYRVTILAVLTSSFALATVACSTAETERAQSVADVSSFTGETAAPLMRHSLREVTSYDSYQMSRLVNRELDLREADEDNFLRNATQVLAQTALVQPHFVERDVALREIKGKLEPEDYNYIVDKAAEQLIYIATKSPVASDQASALVALKNLVSEIEILKRAELKPTIERIANANLQVSDAAKQYAKEPMQNLISPSREARVALQTK